MKKIISLCLLTQLPLIMRAEDLQLWNKLPDIAVYYAAGTRATPPNPANLQKLSTFNAKQENASKSQVIKVDNSQFPQLLVVQEVNGAPGKAGMLYEFKTADGKPIKSGKKLYVRLIQKGNSPKFTKQTYIFNNIDDADIEFIAGKGSQPFNLGVIPRVNPQALAPATEQEEVYQRLIEAVKNNNANGILKALSAGAQINGETAQKLFLETAQKADPKIQNILISADPLPAAIKQNLKRNLAKQLFDAVKKNDASAVDAIIMASPWGLFRGDKELLITALKSANIAIIKSLLERQIVRVDDLREFPWDALKVIIRSSIESRIDAAEKIQLLVKEGILSPEVNKKEKETLDEGLAMAATNNLYDVVQLLVALGADFKPDMLAQNNKQDIEKTIKAGMEQRAAYAKILLEANNKRRINELRRKDYERMSK